MEQWEHNAASFKTDEPLSLEKDELNKLGKAGWELVSTVFHGPTGRTIHYLKRRVPDATAYRG